MKTNQNRPSNSASAVGIIFLIADGTIQSCNPNAEIILGYTARQLVGTSIFKPLWQTIHEDGSLFLPETYPTTTSLKMGEPCSDVVMGMYKPNGNLIWLSVSTLPLFKSSNNKPYGVEVSFIDITVDIDAKIVPKISKESLSHTLNNELLTDFLPGVIYVFDAVARQNIYLNSQAYQSLGYTPQQISDLGADFTPQVMHPDDFALFPAHIEKISNSQQGEICKFEYQMRHQNGDWHWFCSQDKVYSRTADGSVKHILGIARDITNRKRTEIALKESEERLKLATSASGIGMWFLDLVENKVDWTQQGKAILGLSADDELSYERFLSLIHPEDRDRVQIAAYQAVDNQTEYNVKYRILLPDGSIRWIAARGKGFYNQNGEPVRMMGTVQDISDFKEIEENLSQSRQKLKILLDSLPIFTGFLTRDGIITEVNQTALDVAGLQREDVLNKDFRETYWWSYSTKSQAILDDAIKRAATGETVRFDVFNRVKGDRFILIDFGIVPKFNEQGEVEYLVPFAIDISDREASKQALKQSQDKLKLITELIPQQVWTALPDGEVNYVNQRWREYIGATLEQVKQRGWSTIVHPEDFHSTTQVWTTAIETGKDHNTKFRLLNARGKYHWFLSRAKALRNQQGEIIQWYGTNTNISKIKRLEEKLQRQKEDLIQANQLKDEFLAIVSHELRTPLNPILGWSQLLLLKKLDPNQTTKGVAIIERNARLQAQLIDDLLDVSRILQGKLNLKTAPVDLKVVIKSALTTVQLLAEAKSIQIETRFESNISHVLGDANRLQQVVWNLLSNAIKFTSQGGQITVTLKRVGDRALIQVKDTGHGISAEFLPYVFDRFRQAESSSTRRFGGLGLGLAIVLHISELHRGTVSAYSPGEGQGATFEVKLPLINASTI